MSDNFDRLEKDRNDKAFNFIDMFKLTVKNKLLCTDFNSMSAMIKHLSSYRMDLLLLGLDHIVQGVNKKKMLEEMIRMTTVERFEAFNLLSRFIFVVSDLNDLILTIKKQDQRLKSVNAGSQKFRGSTSYINNILCLLDNDFRDSMYNHNLKFFGKNSLSKSKFSYKNIHVNLGYAR